MRRTLLVPGLVLGLLAAGCGVQVSSHPHSAGPGVELAAPTLKAWQALLPAHQSEDSADQREAESSYPWQAQALYENRKVAVHLGRAPLEIDGFYFHAEPCATSVVAAAAPVEVDKFWYFEYIGRASTDTRIAGAELQIAGRMTPKGITGTLAYRSGECTVRYRFSIPRVKAAATG